MKRIILTFVIVMSALLVFPSASSAANLPPIIPGCDQTQYTVTGKGADGNATTRTINSVQYGTTYPINAWEVTGYSLSRDCQLTDFLQVFVNLYSWGLYIISVLALVFMFIGGGTLLFAAGSEERVRVGKTVLKNTIIGLLIALSSWVIVNLALVAILPEDSREGGVATIIKNQPWFKVEADAPPCMPADAPPTYGCSSEVVREYQRQLMTARCFPDPNDSENTKGTFNDGTMAAWLNLQIANNVKPTDVLEGIENLSASCL